MISVDKDLEKAEDLKRKVRDTMMNIGCRNERLWKVGGVLHVKGKNESGIGRPVQGNLPVPPLI